MMGFSSYHPAVLAIYFFSVFIITMFSSNPVAVILALLGGISLYIKINKHSVRPKDFVFYGVMFLVVALTNPLFSHKGNTPLFFINGNPITLEAVLYGINMSATLMAVIFWFKCFNHIMTEDKLLYLFGRISPKVSLLITSALRFIPMMKNQAEKIRQSQKAMGLYASEGWLDKLKGALRVYLILITWALENAIETGDSMKARGYGLKGRTHYSLNKFRINDFVLMMIIMGLDLIIFCSIMRGDFEFSFYPTPSSPVIPSGGAFSMAAFLVLGFIPMILEIKEDLQWKYLKLKI